MKNQTKWIIGGLIIIIAIIIIGSLNSSQIDGERVVKIGFVSPSTGWGAYWAEGYVKGINLAEEEINAKGKRVEMIIEDGATEAQKSASAAQKLINVDKVEGLAVEFTGPASSISPIASRDNIPFIYDALPKKFLDENLYAFKMYFDISRECLVIANYLADQGYKNIGGLFVNLDFAPECEASFEKVAQERDITAKMYTFNLDVTDLRTILTKMKEDNVDAIIPVFYEDQAIMFFTQKHELGIESTVFTGIGAMDVFTEKVRNSVPSSATEGVMTYDQPISDVFKNKLVSKYPAVTEKEFLAAAYGYDEAMYLYNAISTCSYKDSECIIKKMKTDTYVGALSTPGFGEDRIFDVVPTYYKYSQGKFTEFSPSE